MKGGLHSVLAPNFQYCPDAVPIAVRQAADAAENPKKYANLEMRSFVESDPNVCIDQFLINMLGF